MRDDPHSTALSHDVFEAELAVLVARRDASRLDSRTLAANPTAGPSVHRELKGLAISGGGIRSRPSAWA